jgi:CsoR family transcriptional regulator, copper-sensing transcriptional repressor
MSDAVASQHRNELLNRLKRAEGQLRGIQRMIDEDQPTLDVASQLLAVRKALDSTHVHLTMGVVRNSLHRKLRDAASANGDPAPAGSPLNGHDLGVLVEGVVDDVQSLLAKMR